MKLYIRVYEGWPLYAIRTEPNFTSQKPVEVDEATRARWAEASSAFAQMQHEIDQIHWAQHGKAPE